MGILLTACVSVVWQQWGTIGIGGVGPDEAIAAAVAAAPVVLISVTLLLAAVALTAQLRRLDTERALFRRQDANQGASLERLKLVLETMAQGMIVVDGRRRISVLNARLARMLGLPADDAARLTDYDDLIGYFADARACREGDRAMRDDIRALLGASEGPDLRPYLERSRPDGTILAIETRSLPDGGFVRTFTEITELRRSERQLRFLETHDRITGLLDHASFRRHLDKALADSVTGEAVTLLVFDIDGFRHLNEIHGHSACDRLLRLAASRLVRLVRHEDIVARIGGDTFAVLMRWGGSRATMVARGREIAERMRSDFLINGLPIGFTVSGGGAIAPVDATRSDELLRLAHAGLSQVKVSGGSGFAVRGESICR
jgi:diguanylate cyclase